MTGAVRMALEASAVFLRVQDRDGRGPFKPGTTDRWRDPDGPDYPPAQEEFGLHWRAEIPLGWHCGCALRSIEQVARWFSPWECARLDALGYRLVTIRGRALRESRHQIIVVRPLPLRMGALAMPWPHITEAALDPWKQAAAKEGV